MIEELCKRLCERRKELNLTIEEVVEKTKVHPSMIHDIEDGNISNINPTYLRGFIRIYAAFLGVEVQDALEDISSVKAKSKVEKRRKAEPPPRPPRERKPLPPKVKKIIFSVVIVIITIVLSMGMVKFFAGTIKKMKANTRKVVKSVQPPVKAAPVTKETPVKKAAAKETPIKPPIEQKVASPAPVQGDITVSLTAKRNCYMRVRVDNQVLFEGILSKDAVETWKGKEAIEFKISDGSAVYLEVNGKPLPQLTSMRKPIKSLKITPAGISVDK